MVRFSPHLVTFLGHPWVDLVQCFIIHLDCYHERCAFVTFTGGLDMSSPAPPISTPLPYTFLRPNKKYVLKYVYTFYYVRIRLVIRCAFLVYVYTEYLLFEIL